MATDVILPPHAADFLAAQGWGEATVTAIPGDASARRYYRAKRGSDEAILMHAPPPGEDPRPFIHVGQWLVERGFAAPVIHGCDLDHGFLLLQDFGDVRMRETIDASPERAQALYETAIDVLVDLARHPAGPFEAYDHAVLRREADLLVEWYCPAVGVQADAESYHAAWDQVFSLALAAEPVTVLRDYHAENLMLIGENGGRLGLLDFQDALAGHPAYDLVSLLQDARRDVAPETEAAMYARYRAATNAGEDFEAAYHVLGAQRNAKIVGIFTRLWKRDGKERYPALCPRVWRYLERDLAHPALAPVKIWFDATIPAEKRGDPMTLQA
ncbi:aminoglycoside phosphotransferase family protein [Sphingomonas aracearum]|nr:phosphotransferase [Sphingomonas aracearum]